MLRNYFIVAMFLYHLLRSIFRKSSHLPFAEHIPISETTVQSLKTQPSLSNRKQCFLVLAMPNGFQAGLEDLSHGVSRNPC